MENHSTAFAGMKELSPVHSDGDAVLRTDSRDIHNAMDTVFNNGFDEQLGFTMTDGIEEVDGLRVVHDPSGKDLEGYYVNTGAFTEAQTRAYGERVQMMEHPELASLQSVAEGETRNLSSEHGETLVVNAHGTIGEVNLLGKLDYSDNRGSVFIFEYNGGVFYGNKKRFTDGDSYDVNSQESASVVNHEIDAKIFEQENGVQSLDLRVINDEESIEGLQITLTALSESNGQSVGEGRAKAGVLRGALRKIPEIKPRRKIESQDNCSHDISMIKKSIVKYHDDEIASTKRQKEFSDRQQSVASAKVEREAMFEAATNIDALSAKYPESGNIFEPGVGIYEDELFEAFTERSGLEVGGNGILKTVGAADTTDFGFDLGPNAKTELRQMLRSRLDAWARENPAQYLKSEFGITEKMEPHLSVLGHNVKGSRSIMDHLKTDRRTVLNTFLPSDMVHNMPRTSEKPLELIREDDPHNVGSLDHVVNLAYDMMTGNFDYSQTKDVTQDMKYTDREHKYMIHEAQLSRHRAAANMIVYGVC